LILNSNLVEIILDNFCTRWKNYKKKINE